MIDTMLKTAILGRGNVRAILEIYSVILNVFMFMSMIDKIQNILIKGIFLRKIKIFNLLHLVMCLLKNIEKMFSF